MNYYVINTETHQLMEVYNNHTSASQYCARAKRYLFKCTIVKSDSLANAIAKLLKEPV